MGIMLEKHKQRQVRQMGIGSLTRRGALLAGAAALVSACTPGGAQSVGGGAGYRAPDPAPQPVPNAGWDAWVQGFKGRAAGRGISQATIDAAFRGAGFLPDVVERDRNQTEFTRSLEDYLSGLSEHRRLG